LDVQFAYPLDCFCCILDFRLFLDQAIFTAETQRTQSFFDFLCVLSGSAVNSKRNLCVSLKQAKLQLHLWPANTAELRPKGTELWVLYGTKVRTESRMR
jgi:hypothetical protein